MYLGRTLVIAFGLLSQPTNGVLFDDAGRKTVALSRSGNCAALGIDPQGISYRVSKDELSGETRAVVTTHATMRDAFGLPFNGCARKTSVIPQPENLLKISVVRQGYEEEFGTRVVSDIYYKSLSLTR